MRKALDPCASSSGTLSRMLLLTATILAATLTVPNLASAARTPAHAAPAAARHVVARVSQPAHETKATKQATHSAKDAQPARKVVEAASANVHRVSFVKASAAERPAAHVSKTLAHANAGRLSKSNDRAFAGRANAKSGKARVYASRDAVLQCVPFARAASGIELKGNAVNWWDAASGVYERGHRPEAGSVLNFRANGSMRLGHVAVVRSVVNSREIEIDHANWAWSGKGNITRNVAVIDVSDRNDWTAVRVALGNGSDFGSVYSTYGFIYDRPDRGTFVANNAHMRASAPQRDVRGFDEVAEAPGGHASGAILLDAPSRSLR